MRITWPDEMANLFHPFLKGLKAESLGIEPQLEATLPWGSNEPNIKDE